MPLSNSIEKAVEILRSGGLVAFPTETVYGLGADATHAAALKRVFIAKERPMDHPLIVHIGAIDQLSEWVRDVPAMVYPLAHAFWPGPLTLIFKKNPAVLDLVTGNQDTVGVRIPKHPVAQLLLKQFKGGIAAPSANRFGRLSPTQPSAVQEELGEMVDLILEGGECEVGVESTILDLSKEEPRILRPGIISPKQIENILQRPVSVNKEDTFTRVPGSLESHYAPETPVLLLQSDEMLDYLDKIESPVAVLTKNALPKKYSRHHLVFLSENALSYAHDLYRTLRELDKKQFPQIVIEAVPESSEWDAIRDRLKKASALR